MWNSLGSLKPMEQTSNRRDRSCALGKNLPAVADKITGPRLSRGMVWSNSSRNGSRLQNRNFVRFVGILGPEQFGIRNPGMWRICCFDRFVHEPNTSCSMIWP
jgi:hypothetical protein